MRDDESGDGGDAVITAAAGVSIVLAVVLSIAVALTTGSGRAAAPSPAPTTTTTTPPVSTTLPALPAPVGVTVRWSIDGEVLVRGRVQSEEQRDAVVSASEMAFGAENVDSGAVVVASEGGVNADDRIGILVAFVDRMPQRLLAGSARPRVAIGSGVERSDHPQQFRLLVVGETEGRVRGIAQTVTGQGHCGRFSQRGAFGFE